MLGKYGKWILPIAFIGLGITMLVTALPSWLKIVIGVLLILAGLMGFKLLK